jgi:hypothetical protein
MILKWEEIKNEGSLRIERTGRKPIAGGWRTHRTPVAGGWLVLIHYGELSGLTFVPDTSHGWDDEESV